MYGITETTVHVSYRLLHPDDSQSDVSPVGIPIPDLAAYILDPTLPPVPDGIQVSCISRVLAWRGAILAVLV